MLSSIIKLKILRMSVIVFSFSIGIEMNTPLPNFQIKR